MYPTDAAPQGCTLLVLCPKRYKVGHISIIIIINCIYIAPIQNVSFYGTLHKTNLYKNYKYKYNYINPMT